MTLKEIIPIISVATALLAVIVGPIISFQIAKHQSKNAQAIANLNARSNVLSKSRQEWINTLRTEVAGFISTSHMILPILVSQNAPNEITKLLGQLTMHHAKTLLLINPNETDHTALIEKMQDITHHVLGFKGQPSELTNELATISQGILKREWQRVKDFS